MESCCSVISDLTTIGMFMERYSRVDSLCQLVNLMNLRNPLLMLLKKKTRKPPMMTLQMTMAILKTMKQVIKWRNYIASPWAVPLSHLTLLK